MSTITLLTSTGNQRVDIIIRSLIELCESLCPDQIRSYYIVGSYADGTAVATSDLDITLILKDEERHETKKILSQLASPCSFLCNLSVGLYGIGETQAIQEGRTIAFESLLMYGVDIRDQIPRLPLEQYVRRVMAIAVRSVAWTGRSQDIVCFPLNYPDPEGEFYGYDNLDDHTLDGGHHTKGLVSLVSWIATSIIALQTSKYVDSKRACLTLYQELVHDQWTDLITAVFEECRTLWNYCVPKRSEERNRLRQICQQVLEFENYFLELYRDYLLIELQDADSLNRQNVVQCLGKVIYPDSSVLNMLQNLVTTENESLKQTVQITLQRIHDAKVSHHNSRKI